MPGGAALAVQTPLQRPMPRQQAPLPIHEPLMTDSDTPASARHLLAPLVAAGGVPGWRLVSLDAEQGIAVVLGRGDELLVVDFDRRDDQRDCFVRTRWFNVSARPQFEIARSLTVDERQVVYGLAAMVAERESGLPDGDRPPASARQAVREVRVDRMLVPEGRGHYYLNPYVGCTIGCPFCFVADRADLSRHIQGLPKVPWGQWVDVKVNAAEVLAAEVRRLPRGIVRMSPIVTDPYQPVERKHRITRGCLEVLQAADFPVMVLTRGARIVEDAALLARFSRAVVGLSIPTDDDAIRRQFEPGADPIERRLEALRACHQAGCKTVAFVQPMLPMAPERLADLLAPWVHAVRIDRMHAMGQARALYEAAGLQACATDGYFAETAARLGEALRVRGVPVEPIDDLEPLMERLCGVADGSGTTAAG